MKSPPRRGGKAAVNTDALLRALGLERDNFGAFDGQWFGSGSPLVSHSPIDGEPLGTVWQAGEQDYERVATRAHEAFLSWREVPAPKRGEVVRRIGNALRKVKAELGALVSLEVGKIRAEGEGEVQEMIDICDFATGLSRQLYGLSMHSERPRHRMYEQWHPLGVVGVISAFNFPVAVWSWNSALAWVCGDSVLWKPSEKTPLTAIACTKIAAQVIEDSGYDPALCALAIGGPEIGELLSHDARIPLVSATGSSRMGRRVGAVVAERLGRTLLELGGNNAIIVSDFADLDLAVRAVLFGAVGTAGQRCTSTRRLIVHEAIYDELKARLVKAYGHIRIGDPLADGVLMGPLIDQAAVASMQAALRRAEDEGGRVIYGGEVLRDGEYVQGAYVAPAIVELSQPTAISCEETFAPILYLLKYSSLDEAVSIHNNVPQGLSSAIFTLNMREAEAFLSAGGSDCGIANVNIGTSGAEIGGAFGGEKDTGGGRESGSDAWKNYMRRQTNTINWGSELPLAQGITFGE
jgi:aldehyde dehydrogenase (NAD+)